MSSFERLVVEPIDILGLGVTTVDDFLYVDSFPVADSKMRIRRRERQCGGLTATALVAAARLGSRCMYAGTLGDDELSAFVLQTMRNEGIDLSEAHFDADARPVHATVIVEVHRATRTILFGVEGTPGASEAGPAPAVIRSCRVLFVDPYGLPGMIRAASIAREASIPVVGDFESPVSAEMLRLITLVDHLIISEGFAAELSGFEDPSQAATALFKGSRAGVVVTSGANGCWYVERGRHDEAIYAPAFAVDVVDTTGCGDVFHGAYASALARGLDMDSRVRFASAAAALKSTCPGGQAGIPRREQVEAFLLERAAT